MNPSGGVWKTSAICWKAKNYTEKGAFYAVLWKEAASLLGLVFIFTPKVRFFMKKSFLLAGGFALALFFSACGDDSSSTGNVDQETDSSSSSVGDSTGVSSSSLPDVDPSWPAGARAATLDDLNKHQLVVIEGQKFLLATGSKAGVFGLWTLDANESIVNQNILLVVSDFNKGVLTIKNGSSLMPFDSPLAAAEGNKVLKNLSDPKGKGVDLSFIMVGDTLKYRVGTSDFVGVQKKTLDLGKGYVIDGTKLDGKRLACNSSADTTLVYSFYKGRYIMETVAKGDTVSWNAGYMDVFRDMTFMASKFSSPEGVSAADGFGYRYNHFITADMSKMLDLNKTKEIPCKSSELKYSGIAEDSIKGRWSSFEDGKVYWKLNLEDTHSYTLLADDGAKENKNGTWAVYGDQLILDVAGCVGGKCARGIKGPVSKLSKTGFTYSHSEKGTPAMPKAWSVPEEQ